MAELFSADWMKAYMDAWNSDGALADELERINFNAVIGYGYDSDPAPSVVYVVNGGRITSIGPHNGETLNWDLRASPDQWAQWMAKPPSLMALALAYTQRKLRFRSGDYASMVKDPRMAGPFVKSFDVMRRALA
ncbi:MAG: SCP-2 sterol transfer family protein [Chromatiales bacterium]|nr:SCP-2 sterol transfer family protein [Chromatiales bacterium]